MSCHGGLTYIQLIPMRKAGQQIFEAKPVWALLESSPLIVNCLDDEAEGRADGIDILAHDLLDDGSFACIVQTPSWNVSNSGLSTARHARGVRSHSIKILSSLSFSLAFLRIESIFSITMCRVYKCPPFDAYLAYLPRLLYKSIEISRVRVRDPTGKSHVICNQTVPPFWYSSSNVNISTFLCFKNDHLVWQPGGVHYLAVLDYQRKHINFEQDI